MYSTLLRENWILKTVYKLYFYAILAPLELFSKVFNTFIIL